MSKWINVTKTLPEAETPRIVGWMAGQAEPCWFSDGKWYLYDGTFFLTEKSRIHTVTHWMAIDWMTSMEWPAHGPGIVNRVRHHIGRLTQGASDMARDMRPGGWGSKAQLSKKPVFYRDSSGKIMSGMPENVPTPRGLERIVCGSAIEAERYSEIQRRQERVEHGRESERRGAIEAEFQAEIRSEMRTKMANARNPINREFMRRALERNAQRGDPTAYERESYLHAEGFESGR